jgi:(p)ppGpp synthase/HD superfamily hydrolase
VIRHITLAGRFSDAVAYAGVAHAAQVRKGTEVPYLSHLLSVAALVLEHGGEEPQATAAVLHDVVEDHGGQRRLADLRDRFGEDVAELVASLSDAAPADGEAKAPWAERKETYLDHLRGMAQAGHPAMLVSLCDKLHNARAIVADAMDPDGPGPEVWKRFKADPEQIAWYYQALRDVFTETKALPRRAVREFVEVVDELASATSAGGAS